MWLINIPFFVLFVPLNPLLKPLKSTYNAYVYHQPIQQQLHDFTPSVCQLGWRQVFATCRHRDFAKSAGGTIERREEETDSSNGNGIRWAIFTCSPGSKSEQVLEEFRYPKRGPARHENLSVVSKWQLFSSPSSSRSRRSLSKIALCSHEYFIFILLKKRSVAFVLRLLCILTRSSFLFGGKKILVKSINVMRNKDEGWTQRVKAAEPHQESQICTRYHWLNNFAEIIFLFFKGIPEWKPPLLSRFGEFKWESPSRKSPRLWTVCCASIGVTSCLYRAQGHRAIAFLFVFSLSWQPFTFDFEK